MSESQGPILEIQGLRCWFEGPTGLVRAVDGVDLEVQPGEVLGVVGESGSGKSMTFLSVLGLEPQTPGLVAGRLRFRGRDLVPELGRWCRLREDAGGGGCVWKAVTGFHRARERLVRAVRGSGIAMIFQDPVLCLDPLATVGGLLVEAIRRHRRAGSRQAARDLARNWLRRVGIPDPGVLAARPAQLSGGMSQRVLIARALCPEPSLVIADEPTTALDAVVQLKVLELLTDLRRELGLTVVLISHDLRVVSRYAQRMAVFKDGRVVDRGETDLLLRAALGGGGHPYTRRLVGAAAVGHHAGHPDPEPDLAGP